MREQTRAWLIAWSSKLTELIVCAKVRWQGGEPTEFDRRMLHAMHRRMLDQIEHMRRVMGSVHSGFQPAPTRAGVHNAAVVLCASESSLRAEAQREAASLLSVLGAGVKVHHIGSTAIDQLAAKPIVDLAVALPPARFDEEFASVRTKLQRLDYRYLGVRGGHFFEKASAAVRTHALQVHPADSEILAELLRFRDALHQEDSLRSEYQAVKRTLAAYFSRQRLMYVLYKSHWIDDWQWRHSDEPDWAGWLLGQKRAHARLARGVSQGK